MGGNESHQSPSFLKAPTGSQLQMRQQLKRKKFLFNTAFISLPKTEKPTLSMCTMFDKAPVCRKSGHTAAGPSGSGKVPRLATVLFLGTTTQRPAQQGQLPYCHWARDHRDPRVGQGLRDSPLLSLCPHQNKQPVPSAHPARRVLVAATPQSCARGARHAPSRTVSTF